MSEFYRDSDKNIIEIHKMEDFFPDYEVCGFHIPEPHFDEGRAVQHLYDELSPETKCELAKRLEEAVLKKYNFKENGDSFDAYNKDTGMIEFSFKPDNKDRLAESCLLNHFGYSFSDDICLNNFFDICADLNITDVDLFMAIDVYSNKGICYPFIENERFQELYGADLSTPCREAKDEAEKDIREICKNIFNGEVYEYSVYAKDTLEEIDSCRGYIGPESVDEIKEETGAVEYLGEYLDLEEYLIDSSLEAKLAAAEEKSTGSNEGKDNKAYDDMEL